MVTPALDRFFGAIENDDLRELSITTHEFIMASSVGLIAKIAHGIPFYYGIKRIFYLNPGRDHVILGFCYGMHIETDGLTFEQKGHKQVGPIRLTSMKQLEDPRLQELVNQAILIDRQHDQINQDYE